MSFDIVDSDGYSKISFGFAGSDSLQGSIHGKLLCEGLWRPK